LEYCILLQYFNQECKHVRPLCGARRSGAGTLLDLQVRRQRPVQGSAAGKLAAFSSTNYNTVVAQTVPVECIGLAGHEFVPMRWGMDRIDRAAGEIAKKKLYNARVEGYR
jgi:hypothetical protein